MFPVTIPLGPLRLPPHPVFESLGYLLGFQLYRLLRRHSGDPISAAARGSVIVAAALGGLVGSKLLAWLDDPAGWASDGATLGGLGGKSIVGGLLGGWLLVEAVKRMHGERRSTGDLFALPLCLGVAVGRVGCFLTGLADRTHGNATSLPWGVDFGDGLRRHPTQLYEIAALVLIAGAVMLAERATWRRDGDRFRIFLGLYLMFRFAVEFLKPAPMTWLGLRAIQWACLAGLAWYVRAMIARLHSRSRPSPAAAGTEAPIG